MRRVRTRLILHEALTKFARDLGGAQLRAARAEKVWRETASGAKTDRAPSFSTNSTLVTVGMP
jgi:hypothetical protein